MIAITQENLVGFG